MLHAGLSFGCSLGSRHQEQVRTSDRLLPGGARDGPIWGYETAPQQDRHLLLDSPSWRAEDLGQQAPISPRGPRRRTEQMP